MPAEHLTQWRPSLFNSIYNNSLLPKTQESIYPFHSFSSNSIAKQFAFEKFMRGGGVSKAFSKSNIKVSTWPSLSKIFAQSSITVISWVSQLCHFLNACCFCFSCGGSISKTLTEKQYLHFHMHPLKCNAETRVQIFGTQLLFEYGHKAVAQVWLVVSHFQRNLSRTSGIAVT